MLPFTNFTFGSIVNTVCRGDCVAAGLSIVVPMMLCSDTPPKIFLSCFAGASVVCSVCDRGAAEATLENARGPITPTKTPIRYLLLRIPLPSLVSTGHSIAQSVKHITLPLVVPPPYDAVSRLTEVPGNLTASGNQ